MTKNILLYFIYDSKNIFYFIIGPKGRSFDFLNNINLYVTRLLIKMVIML